MTMHRSLSLTLLAIVLVTQSACSAQSPRATDPSSDPTQATDSSVELLTLDGVSAGPVHARQFTIVAMKQSERFYRVETAAPLLPDYAADSEGVPISTRKGTRYFHPVDYAQQGLRQLASFQLTKDSRYLERTERIAQELLAHSEMSRGGMWFAYPFDFALHGNVSETAHAPWYSGMAQGQVLSLFSRLYEVTKSERYADAAVATFKSLAPAEISHEPWVSHIVDGYFWIEEYPSPMPDRTLNGYMFAIIGLYDYLQATYDLHVLPYLRASLTTIEDMMKEFEVPGEISFYCLTHKVQSKIYHQVHIQELKFLAAMASSPSFDRWAETLQSDQ